MNIAFIGLGNMGAPMARNLLKAGHSLNLFDLNKDILAELAASPGDTDLRVLPAPAALPECTTWVVLPRGRVLRDFTLRLVCELAPQIDTVDVRRAVAGNAEPAWPEPPAWPHLRR